jgi:hypothetical protein
MLGSGVILVLILFQSRCFVGGFNITPGLTLTLIDGIHFKPSVTLSPDTKTNSSGHWKLNQFVCVSFHTQC